MSRKYHHVDYQSILNGNKKEDRLALLFDQIKNIEKEQGKTPPPQETEELLSENPIAETCDNDHMLITEESKNTSPDTDKVEEVPTFSPTEAEEVMGYYTETDDRLTEAIHYVADAIKIAEIVKNIQNAIRICQEQIGEEDRIIQDILHEARLPMKDKEQGFALYSLLHQAERRRQDYKDLLEPLIVLGKYITTHQGIFEGFIGTVKQAEQRILDQDKRIYMQRATDLKLPVGNAYRSLPKKDQEKMRLAYEANRKKDKYSFSV